MVTKTSLRSLVTNSLYLCHCIGACIVIAAHIHLVGILDQRNIHELNEMAHCSPRLTGPFTKSVSKASLSRSSDGKISS